MNNSTRGNHRPLEIFGFIPNDKSKRAKKQRKSRICPFNNLECTKKLYRTNKPPNGSCSVTHLGKPCIICPTRFQEGNNKIVLDAAKLVLGKNKKIEFVREVSLPLKFGRVDWLGFVFEKNKIKDFVPIEVQANQTTQTGGLTDALLEFEKTGKFSKNHYNYGINTYHQTKTFFTQCLNKSQLFSNWNKKSIWILEEQLFANWLSRFNLKLKDGSSRGQIIFLSYGLDFDKKEKRYHLSLKKTVSANQNELLDAYNRPAEDLPTIEEFVKSINRRKNRR